MRQEIHWEGTSMDAIVTEAVHTFTGQEERFLAVITGLPTRALNWSPGPDMNSLAVLTVHTWVAAVAWTERAAGHEIARDREAEFHVVLDEATLASLIRQQATDVREATQTLTPADFATLRARPNGEAFTVAYCLIHALEHTQEHLGQALLTRQLWEQTQGLHPTAEDDDGYRLPTSPTHG